MSVYDMTYMSLLALSLGISLYSYNAFDLIPSLKVFPFLLSLSLLTEIVVHIISYKFKQDYNFIYHFYLPADYALLAYFFYLNSSRGTIKQLIRYSIPVYIAISLLISLYYYHSSGGTFPFPGLNLNIEGLLLILWSLIALFSIKPTIEVSIFKLPVFWICLGVLLFFSGTFFFNGIYNNLIQTESPLARTFHIIIIKGLNYVLYICLSIGFICANQMKKYLSPSLPERF